MRIINDNNCFLRQLVSSKEVVNQLLEYKYYDKDIPLCLLPNTDVFVNPKNIEYLLDLLQELENQNVIFDNNTQRLIKLKILNSFKLYLNSLDQNTLSSKEKINQDFLNVLIIPIKRSKNILSYIGKSLFK